MIEKENQHNWKSKPMSGQATLIEVQVPLSKAGFNRLKAGVVPGQMEDKWFTNFKDNWIFIHQYRTGNCIYRAEIHPAGPDSYEIKNSGPGVMKARAPRQKQKRPSFLRWWNI